ncbi:MAG: chemotaxis response regulator protein-glutamate methylesterase [Dehalococcoidia bacterium]
MAWPRVETGKGMRVLIVDDSPFMRRALERQLAEAPDVTVVGKATDGLEAVKLALELRPDVITMDVEMPRMDGIQAVTEIMQAVPTPIVMVSTLTKEGAEVTLRALEAGAVEYVAKPSGLSHDIVGLGDQLRAAVFRASHARVRRMRPKPQPVAPPPSMVRAGGGHPSRQIVVIGSSTGGPPALTDVIPRLPGNFPAGVLVVQHMPRGFTEALSRRLDAQSPLEVREAQPGDAIAAGTVLVAPGDYHMTVTHDRRVAINQDPPRHGVRPSVDVTLESVARVYGRDATVAILTGMGKDGAAGCVQVENAGGQVFVQDEDSCVVYGMPKVAKEWTTRARQVTLAHMADALVRAVERAP